MANTNVFRGSDGSIVLAVDTGAEGDLAQSVIDKGAIAKRVLRALYDALYTMQTTKSVPGTGGVSTGPTLPGQTPPPAPPPPPPAPPAPPPPPH